METRAIVTVCVGRKFEALSAITHPQFEKYANKCRARFIVWKDVPKVYKHPHFRVFAVADELCDYDRVLLLDSDIYIKDWALDIFDYVPQDKMGMCDEAGFRSVNWARNRMQRSFIFNNRVLEQNSKQSYRGVWNGSYYNGGVELSSRPHRIIYKMPSYDVEKVAWDGGELIDGQVLNQPYLNFMIHYHNIPMFDIGYRFNCTNPLRKKNNRSIEHVRQCFFFHATGGIEVKTRTLRKLLPILQAPMPSSQEQ